MKLEELIYLKVDPVTVYKRNDALTRPRGYKTFFILNSVEHEILNPHKYKNINKFGLFRLR